VRRLRDTSAVFHVFHPLFVSDDYSPYGLGVSSIQADL